MSIKIRIVFFVTLLGALGLGYLGSTTPLAEATAGCGVGWNTKCTGGDNTLTAVLDAYHYEVDGQNLNPVEPDDGETWAVVAYYQTIDDPTFGPPALCRCNEQAATSVLAAVTWTGSGWSVTCTGCNPTTGPIYSISICSLAGCGSDTHGYAYRMTVDAARSWSSYVCLVDEGTWPRYLDHVAFTTTSVDDGKLLNVGMCSLGATVSPDAAPYSATDSGAFECSYTCLVSGATVNITYD